MRASPCRKSRRLLVKTSRKGWLLLSPSGMKSSQLFDGVISGVPHDCLIIVVSNSQRKQVDRFRMEQATLNQFCHFTRRQALIIHQKDPILAQALSRLVILTSWVRMGVCGMARLRAW